MSLCGAFVDIHGLVAFPVAYRYWVGWSVPVGGWGLGGVDGWGWGWVWLGLGVVGRICIGILLQSHIFHWAYSVRWNHVGYVLRMCDIPETNICFIEIPWQALIIYMLSSFSEKCYGRNVNHLASSLATADAPQDLPEGSGRLNSGTASDIVWQ